MTLLLYRLCYPVFWCGVALLSPLHRKARRGFYRRFGLAQRVTAAKLKNPIWCHVASSGELEQALPILDRIKEKKSSPPIFISYFSPSGEKAIQLETERRKAQGRKLCWDAHDYSPFDFSFGVKSFLKALRPKKLILIHRELWPEMVHQTLRNRIDIYWVNVSLPAEKPFLVRKMQKQIAQFRYTGTLDEVGDSRVDRILDRKALNKGGRKKTEKKTLIAASIWREDWREIKGGIFRLLRGSNDWRVWIAPHELSSGLRETILSDFRAAKLDVEITRGAMPTSDGNVYWEVVGKLAELYRTADLVFVGNSFKSKVHNVLEPAAYGCPILTGPYYQNSREAVFFQRSGGLKSVDKNNFGDLLWEIAKSEKIRSHMSSALDGYFEKHRGAASRYATAILNE